MTNQNFKNTLTICILLIGGLLFTQCEKGATEVNGMTTDLELRTGTEKATVDVCTCIEENFPVETLSVEEEDALLLMREEEKLARDVYLAMADKWELRVFSNISQSEQRHMDAMLCLINKYDLDDPVGVDATGVFANTALQTLYDNLIAQGNISPKDALLVGAKIEDLDIADLMNLRNEVDNEDILAVFNELTKGSRNHMRAFVKNLVREEVTYTPEFISLDLFEDIIASSMERGGGLCQDDQKCQNKKKMKNKNKMKGQCGNSGQGNGGQGNGSGNGSCDGTGQGNGGNGNGPGDGNCDGSGQGNKDNGSGSGNGGNGNGGNGNGGNGGGGN
jgi:hypothetical protein